FLTRVPPRPVPNLPRGTRWLIPVADAFMFVMFSRPKSGSLRGTWVTPASLLLGLVVGIEAGGLAYLLTAGSPSALQVGGAALLLLLCVGSLALTLVALLQRLVRRS